MENCNTLLVLDLQKPDAKRTVRCKKGDTARVLEIRLLDGLRPYVLQKDVKAVFTARKKDGTSLYNTCEIRDQSIYYPFTGETTSCPGLTPCEIRLYGADGGLITTARFYLEIYDAVYNSREAEKSQDQQTALDDLVKKTLALQESLQKKLESGAFQGESAYQTAVRLGYQGTEEKWISDLRYDHSEEFAALAEAVRQNALRAEAAADRAEAAESAFALSLDPKDGGLNLTYRGGKTCQKP